MSGGDGNDRFIYVDGRGWFPVTVRGGSGMMY
jgi:hypothetical protein